MGSGWVEVELAVMISGNQIRVMAEQLSLSKMSLDDFEEWLSKASWNMHKDSDDEARKLVGAIELCLAESEAKTDSDTIGKIGKIAGFVRIGEKPQVFTTSIIESIPVFSFQFEMSADADRPLEMVFA